MSLLDVEIEDVVAQKESERAEGERALRTTRLDEALAQRDERTL